MWVWGACADSQLGSPCCLRAWGTVWYQLQHSGTPDGTRKHDFIPISDSHMGPNQVGSVQTPGGFEQQGA